MATQNPSFPTASTPAKRFVQGLLCWNETENERQMPWKGEKNPYRIWLSEIILQQTRVEQGRAYYERFIRTFPTVQELAAAPEQAVFKLWEGLGYYSRCRNLITAAKTISEERGGEFPADYETILSLKGVGPYTAAAIASFAYNLPHAVLDGNVFRVLSRIFAIETPIDSTEGKKLFTKVAQSLLPKGKAGEYNQAIMDFGATICKPVPECASCFFNNHCAAFKLNRQALLPVKEKKTLIRERWFHYVILQHKDRIAIRQRKAKDIWQSLYEPLLIEGEKTLSKAQLLLHLEKEHKLKAKTLEVISAAAQRTQKLSHQTIHFSFLHLQIKDSFILPDYSWVSIAELGGYPFPKTLHEFLSKNLG
ncbi:MAG: adenine glycosylase [Flaviaesturariibacter sp.]|nr:adenine glycosylase [Flaviaesturariibacter sp.]